MSRARTAAALFTAPLIAVALATAVAAPAGAVPRTPKPLTCQGQGVDARAKVRARTETVIDAPLSTVWKLQTEVERWPDWQAHVTSMERLGHGPFRPGTVFRWTTPVPPNPATPATSLDITSTVRQSERGSCIRWTGPAVGEGLHIDGVHVWTFTPVRGGVLVRTEETHTGAQVDANVPYATEVLKQGLEAWLDALETEAESRAGDHRPC